MALAFGVSSGVGAEAGLITAVVAGFIAAVFGGEGDAGHGTGLEGPSRLPGRAPPVNAFGMTGPVSTAELQMDP